MRHVINLDGRNGAAFASNNFRGEGFRGEGFRGDRFDRGFRGRRFGAGALAFGLGVGYGYPYDYGYDDYPYAGYAYNDTYYDDGGCYLVRRRVSTPYGWRLRTVQVCG